MGNYVFQERYGVGRVQVALGYALVEQHSGIDGVSGAEVGGVRSLSPYTLNNKH